MSEVSRRTFLLAGTAASGAFLIGAGWTTAEAQVEKTDRLNAWLEIAPSGIVTVTTGRVEMGQGTYTGLAIAMIGFAAAVFYAVRRLTGVETAPTGYTTLVTLLILFGGLQLIGIGLIGEYLGRIYDEVKQRPLYVLKRPPPRA